MHISIALWSHPRSLSTAFERSFMERGDFQVFHEEFAYVYYMHEKRAEIPHKNEDLSHPRTYGEIRDLMEGARVDGPVFHKDFPYHVLDHLLKDPDYLRGQVNTFLIRDPEEAVPSHLSVHPGLGRDALGYRQLVALFDVVRELTGTTPVVINARDLTENSANTMSAYCEAVEIPFLAESLKWNPGQKAQWKTWQGWHTDVASSSGFAVPAGRWKLDEADIARARAFIDECRPHYEYLDSFCLKQNDVIA